MRRKYINNILIINVVIILIITTKAWSAFEIDNTGARAIGMSGAFCAVADNTDALVYNPAGLAQIKSSTAAFNYMKLHAGLDDGEIADNHLAYLQPLNKLGTIGISWYQRSLRDLYQEDIVNLAYGVAIDKAKRYLIGGNLKFLNQSYKDKVALQDNEYFSEKNSNFNVSVDLAGLIKFNKYFSLGMSLANINQPKFSLTDQASILPLQIRVGSALRTQKFLGGLELYWQGDNFSLATGGEAWWFEKFLGTRLGFNMGNKGLQEFTSGISIYLESIGLGWQLDYAFVMNIGDFMSTEGTHQLNLTLSFGTENKKVKPTTTLTKYKNEKTEQTRLKGRNSSIVVETNKLLRQAEAAVKNNYRDANFKLTFAYREKALKSEIVEAKKLVANKKYKHAQLILKAVLQEIEQLKKFKQSLEDEPEVKSGESEVKSGESEVKSKKLILGPKKRSRNKKIPTTGHKVKVIKMTRPAPTPVVEKDTVGEKIISKKVVNVSKTSGSKEDEINQYLRRRARGAYGRVVKLMLTVEKLGGKKYFTTKYQALKRELALIKVLIKSEDYNTSIRYAEGMYPKLKKMEREAKEKNKIRKAMPTEW